MIDIEQNLHNFVTYSQTHLKGDEKGEAQIFLDHLFVAFGHPQGVKGAGATLEDRIKIDKNTQFADLVWKPRVLIEMKKRGENLEKHLPQAANYWWHLVPDRPAYMILCNFDEFWIYDFEKNVQIPVEKIALADLPTRHSAFGFLLPTAKKPIFANNAEDVTLKVADKVVQVYMAMTHDPNAPVPHEDALRFCLQCVIAMFSEDVGLLPDFLFTRIVEICYKKEDSSYDLIGALFCEMNSKGITPAGKFKGTDYFNGGLFKVIKKYELSEVSLEMLLSAAKMDWRNVNPAIFGAVFQRLMEKGERHILGAHFTTEADIRKIIYPCIVFPWQEKIAEAETLTECLDLLTEMTKYTVLDPSCGSGNFLFVAFKELKILEAQLLRKIRDTFNKPDDAKTFSIFLKKHPFVNTSQFYGYDVNPLAVELAKVTLMVAKEISILNTKEVFDNKNKPLPLDNLDENIICQDALLNDNGTPREWHKVSVVIGNPPFQSRSKMLGEFGKIYLEKLWTAYPDFNRYADFCTFWFQKAHQTIPQNGFAGLVATNTIRENNSRENSLDYIIEHGGELINAVSSQPWDGEAVVHVSIVSWKKGTHNKPKTLYVLDKKGILVAHDLPTINSSLSLGIDVTSAKVLACQTIRKFCSQGLKHGHEGFLVDVETAQRMIKANPKNAEVLKPYLIGAELVGKKGSQPQRYVIDFSQLTLPEAKQYPEPYAHILKEVQPEREKLAEEQEKENAQILQINPKATLDKSYIQYNRYWWQLIGKRLELLEEMKGLNRYIVCSQVSKRNIFEFICKDITPNAAVMVFTFEDDYTFGILQSKYHWEWWKAKGSTLKGDYRYTVDTVWDTFPFPQKPTQKKIEAVAQASVALRQGRRDFMQKFDHTLRDLYREMEEDVTNPIHKLQNALDKAVGEAYGFAGKADVLTDLLALNLQIAQNEAQGVFVQGAGLPPYVQNPAQFITNDCVKMG
jgi:hypothetical protein